MSKRRGLVLACLLMACMFIVCACGDTPAVPSGIVDGVSEPDAASVAPDAETNEPEPEADDPSVEETIAADSTISPVEEIENDDVSASSAPTVNPMALREAEALGLDTIQQCRELRYWVNPEWEFLRSEDGNSFYYEADGETLTVSAIVIDSDMRELMEKCEEKDDWTTPIMRWTENQYIPAQNVNGTPGANYDIPGAEHAWQVFNSKAPTPDLYTGCVIVGDEWAYHIWFRTDNPSTSPFEEIWQYLLATASVE